MVGITMVDVNGYLAVCHKRGVYIYIVVPVVLPCLFLQDLPVQAIVMPVLQELCQYGVGPEQT